MLDIISQIAITVFGLSALFLMQLDCIHWRRRGIILGIIGQPFWYIQLVIHDQWGMMPVFFGYTGVWCFGFWIHFIKRRHG